MRATLLFLTIGLICGPLAQAQIDPSSALLLNSGSHSSGRDSGLDSGRYTVRPKSDSSSRREETRSPRRAQSFGEPETTSLQTPAAASQESTSRENENPSTETKNEAGSLGVPQPAKAGVAPAETSEPKATDKGLEETSEKSTQSSGEPSESLVGDRRLNLLELSVAPAYIYNNSDSSFFYRNYFASAPAISVSANVWLNPNLGLSTSYLGTLSGHVNDSFDGSKNSVATQQWFTAGVRSRQFFGGSPGSSLLVFGLDYYEYQFRVASDAVLRQRLRSTGVRLSVETELPTSPRHSWTLGFSLLPRLSHKEEATGIEFQSGSGVETNTVSLSLGSRFEFDRTSAVYWKLSHMIEKNLFSGDASVSDPIRGVTPSGVAVTNSFTIFELGYTWGD